MWIRLIAAGAALIAAAGAYLLPLSNERKLIALTFDDGPRPATIFGTEDVSVFATSTEGLAGVLGKHNATASFFVMGWRLDDKRAAAAAQELSRRGFVLENHSYGHGTFRAMTDKFGEDWVLNDIERASSRISELTGRWPRFVRPPQWEIWDDFKKRLEDAGYRVMTKAVGGIRLPKILEDVDTEDYRHYLDDSDEAVKKLVNDVRGKIRARERLGAGGHILAFHELPITVKAVDRLIPALRADGYEFVSLDLFIDAVAE